MLPPSRLQKIGGAPSTAKHFRSEIRNKSGNTPETLENKGDSLPRLISELCYSQYGNPFFFGRAPFMEQPELVMKFLTVLGAPLKKKQLCLHRLRNLNSKIMFVCICYEMQNQFENHVSLSVMPVGRTV